MKQSKIKKGEWALLFFVFSYFLVFSTIYYLSGLITSYPYSFLIFISVITIFLISRYIDFQYFTLILLALWGFLHMVGGTAFNGNYFYNQPLINIFSTENFMVLQYDQLVHFIGFGAATLAGWRILHKYFTKQGYNLVTYVLIFSVGITIGVINEIIEFIVAQINPQNMVGGYYNTMLDLIFDGLGSVTAIIYIYFTNEQLQKNRDLS